jgi:putative SOS response-associated peptidase YedK
MCYKSSTPGKDQLEGYFNKQEEKQRYLVKDDFAPYYHADGFLRPFLPFTANEDDGSVSLARWKLLPFIVKNEEEAGKYANTLNARCEDVFEKFSYKHCIGKTHGLLWVNGFFEPHRPTPKISVPYFIRAVDSEPFTLGCLYTNWVNKDTGELIRTFSIITTPPNKLLSEIHTEGQRMPLIISPENRKAWLHATRKEDIIALMKPLPDGYLTGYQVNNIINKERGLNTADTLLPV